MSSEKKFPDKKSLSKWLISATGIVLTSVSLLSDIQDIEFQFNKPEALSSVMQASPDYFPEGEYIVKFSNSDDLDEDDLDYSKMVMVISLEAKLARRNILIGGLQPLLKNLSDFEYSCAIDKTNKAYYTAAIWVVEPKAPDEIEKLKNILDEYAVFYAFNDGTGFVSMNNARMGNGTHQLVET